MTTLHLTRPIFEQFRKHGEQTYPYECCGVLLGHSNDQGASVEAAIPAGNVRTDSARNRYQIAPQELVRIERESRRQGLSIIGFYHSHPDHPAHWSATDLAEAHWLGCAYVITEIAHGKAAITNSFRLAGSTEEEKHFKQQTILVDGAPSAPVTDDKD